MGLAGLSLSWHLMHQYQGTPIAIANTIGAIAAMVFVILSLAYLVKLIKYPQSVFTEFRHPVTRNFFGTIPIAMLLLSAIINPYYQTTSEYLWTTGSLLTLALGLYIVLQLKRGNQEPQHVVPALFIPSVGSLNISATGAPMSMPWAAELSLFSTATGTFLALIFMVMVMSRLIHQDPLIKKMIPSLMILVAPFEVGFLVYTSASDTMDRFAGMLFYAGLFLFIMLVFKIFRRGIPFTSTWWAIGFPVAALSNAALKYAWIQDTAPLWLIAYLILALLNLIIVVLTIKTLLHLFKGQLLTTT